MSRSSSRRGRSESGCLDKFYSERNVEQQTRIYHELRKQLSPDEARVFDECIKLDGEIDLNEERLQYIYGHGIEEADQILEPGSFDFIVSRAVIHNVYDIDAASKRWIDFWRPAVTRSTRSI